MEARWTKSAPEARHNGAKMAMLPATAGFWSGFGSILAPTLNDYWENGRSVKTNNPPSLLVCFPSITFGVFLGVWGLFGWSWKQPWGMFGSGFERSLAKVANKSDRTATNIAKRRSHRRICENPRRFEGSRTGGTT